MQAAPGRHDRRDRHDRPEFRQDLFAELIDEQGARFIDVMDPDSGTAFRFYEVEYSLACAMDGERDVPGIMKWAQEELGFSPSQQEVRTVITTLGDLGFIAGGETVAQPEPGVVAALHAEAASHLEPRRSGHGAASSATQATAPETTPAGRATAKFPVQMPDDVAPGVPGPRPTPPAPSPPVPSAPALSVPEVSSVVSIDLSDHIAVRPDDVKEAVRASKVIAAVAVPPELLEAIEDGPTMKAASLVAKPSENAREPWAGISRPPEVSRPPVVPRPSETAQEARPAPSPLTTRQPAGDLAEKPPVALSAPPVAKPVPQPVARTRVSPVLVVLLILAVLGGGAFLAWKYVLENQSAHVETSAAVAPPPAKPPEPPPPPPPPPAPASKVVMETAAADELKATRAGEIETILADSVAVKAGDVIVKLVGDKPIEADIARLSRDEKRLQAQIELWTKRRDAAQAAGNQAAEAAAETALAGRQKTLATKQRQLEAKTKALDKFLIHAPSSGTFTPVSKLGQKVDADAVVAKIQRDATPVATFKVTDVKPFTANASVELAVGEVEQRVTCTIAEVQSDSIKVTCPIDPALTDGAAVTLQIAAAPTRSAPTEPVPAAPPAPASGSSEPK
jgi:biotin carboxyl carrier protein